MSVKSYNGGSGAAFLGQASLAHYFESRLHIPGLNSGDAIVALNGTTRWGGVGQGAFYTGPLFQFRAGATPPVYREANGRRWIEPQPGVAAYSTAYLRRYALTGNQLDAIDFRDVYGPTTSPITGGVPTLLAVRVGGLFQKVAAGDATSCRFTFGFADNTVQAPTAPIARVGLLGDGLLGYRFGSVNCPDGGPAAENAHTDIDANSVQPPELVNPGTTPFYVEITMVPPTPVTGGFWFAKLNGRIAAAGGAQAIFRTLANFPRGAFTVNHNFNRIEGLWLSNEGTQGRVPMSTQMSAVWTEELTLG